MVDIYIWFTFCCLLQLMLSIPCTTMRGELGCLFAWYLIFYVDNSNEFQATTVLLHCAPVLSNHTGPKAKIQFCSLDFHILSKLLESYGMHGMGPIKKCEPQAGNLCMARCLQVKATKVAGHCQFVEDESLQKGKHRELFPFFFEKMYTSLTSNLCKYRFYVLIPDGVFFFFFGNIWAVISLLQLIYAHPGSSLCKQVFWVLFPFNKTCSFSEIKHPQLTVHIYRNDGLSIKLVWL